MIKATIKLSSMFVDKPRTMEILLNENDIAMEPMNEATGVKKKITVGQLFDLYKKGNVYYADGSEPDEQVTPDLFEQWFYFKHLKENNLMQRLISIDYTRIK